MIYGFFDFHERIPPESSVSAIYNALKWNGSRHFAINAGGLTAGCILPPEMKVKEKDFFFHDVRKGVMVFMDGHIYNYHEITQQLSFDGSPASIPELVYYAFLQWGDNFPAFFNGDFSICVFQLKKNRASFYRDHLGIRPLAVSVSKSGIYFATDPMGLCYALYGDREPDKAFLINHFIQGSPLKDYRMLPNNKVENIRPGSGCHVQSGEMKVVRYWEVDRIKRDKKITFDKAMEDLNFLLHDAVRIRSDQNAKAGAHVSAGIDSSVVAALARQNYPHQKEFFGFTWTPDYPVNKKELLFDERERVNEIGKINGITPVFTNFKLDDYVNSITNWRYPSLLLMENVVARQAQKKNVSLIFSGWGGDDFISIGHRGLDASLIKEWAWKSFLKKYPLSRPKKFASALIFKVLFPALRRPYNRRKTFPELFVYVKKALKTNYLSKKRRMRFGSRRDVHLQLLDLEHLGKRTGDWYILGRRYGLEYRYPLLDKRIVEYMLKIPTKCLVGGNNYRIILRYLGRDVLPKSILQDKAKADPVFLYFFYQIVDQFRDKEINGSMDFLDCPQLQFVDMEKLKIDIQKYKSTRDQKLEHRINEILPPLISAHEFIKGYSHSQNPEENPTPKT
ncbi:MAG: asparagine synthase-related protein [Bacteroidales bacterium]